jgi:hypothetical protein
MPQFGKTATSDDTDIANTKDGDTHSYAAFLNMTKIPLYVYKSNSLRTRETLESTKKSFALLRPQGFFLELEAPDCLSAPSVTPDR